MPSVVIFGFILFCLIVKEVQAYQDEQVFQVKMREINCKALLISFNARPTWPKLSYLAKVIQFQAYGYLFCVVCHRSKGALNRKGRLLSFQTDHILPRSIPEFKKYELELSNTQITCEECNQSKSNIDYTDWR